MGCGNTKGRQEIALPQRVRPFDDEKPVTHPVVREPKKSNPNSINALHTNLSIQQTNREEHKEADNSVIKLNEVNQQEQNHKELAKSNLESKKKTKPKAEPSLADRSLNLSQELSEIRYDDPKFNFKDGELSPIGEEDEMKKNQNQTKQSFSEKVVEKEPKQIPEKKMDAGQRKYQPETQQLMRQSKRVTIKEPIQIKEIEQIQPEPKNIRPRREKQGIFDWPARGEVQLKTISFKLRYNIGIKSFKIVKSNDKYTTSKLQWEQDDAGYYECKLTDLFATAIKTGNSVEINVVPIKFVIDINGKFVEITNEDELLEHSINARTKKAPVTQMMREKLKKTMRQEFLKVWKTLINVWGNLDQNKELITGQVRDSDRDCFLLNKTINFPDEQIRSQLIKTLKDKDAYYRLLSSKKMIKNKMKHWELDKDSSSVSDAQLLARAEEKGDRWSKEYLDRKHRSIKTNFLLTERFENFSAIAEARGMLRPHYASYEGAKKIIVDIDSDLYIDIEQEMFQLMMYWPDLTELAKDDNLVSVMTDFRDGCHMMLEDLMKEVSGIPKLPLEYRVKRVEEHTVIEEKAEEEGKGSILSERATE